MTYLYTTEERQATLQTLRIKPKQGKVNVREAASILTWRAMNEFGIEHTYPTSIIRRHVEQKNLKAYPVIIDKNGDSKKNLYDVKEVFELSIEPQKGLKQKKLASTT